MWMPAFDALGNPTFVDPMTMAWPAMPQPAGTHYSRPFLEPFGLGNGGESRRDGGISRLLEQFGRREEDGS